MEQLEFPQTPLLHSMSSNLKLSQLKIKVLMVGLLVVLRFMILSLSSLMVSLTSFPLLLEGEYYVDKDKGVNIDLDHTLIVFIGNVLQEPGLL